MISLLGTWMTNAYLASIVGYNKIWHTIKQLLMIITQKHQARLLLVSASDVTRPRTVG